MDSYIDNNHRSMLHNTRRDIRHNTFAAASAVAFSAGFVGLMNVCLAFFCGRLPKVMTMLLVAGFRCLQTRS